jgi:segregation and condensation protein B
MAAKTDSIITRVRTFFIKYTISFNAVPRKKFQPADYSMSDAAPYKNENQIKQRLEALLFVASEAVTPAQLAGALDLPVTAVEEGLKQLDVDYANRGLRLQRHAGRVQLTTAPEFGATVERFLGLEATTQLSRAALETLAIVAYEQPVTRPQIDAIRGVNSEGVLRSLLHKGLVQEVGRADGPGRPILYSTTPEFLQQFGLNNLGELPPLDPIPQENIQPPMNTESHRKESL